MRFLGSSTVCHLQGEVDETGGGHRKLLGASCSCSLFNPFEIIFNRSFQETKNLWIPESIPDGSKSLALNTTCRGVSAQENPGLLSHRYDTVQTATIEWLQGLAPKSDCGAQTYCYIWGRSTKKRETPKCKTLHLTNIAQVLSLIPH